MCRTFIGGYSWEHLWKGREEAELGGGRSETALQSEEVLADPMGRSGTMNLSPYYHPSPTEQLLEAAALSKRTEGWASLDERLQWMMAVTHTHSSWENEPLSQGRGTGPHGLASALLPLLVFSTAITKFLKLGAFEEKVCFCFVLFSSQFGRLKVQDQAAP